MSKAETSFWLVFSSGLLSSFLGAILGIVIYPAAKQLLGEYAGYLALLIWLAASGVFFWVSNRLITLLLKRE